jgi:alpha-aminoadipate carrier protein LysW
MERVMATCPECDADIEIDDFDVERGDVVSCPECGSNLAVAGLSPLELELVTDEDDDDDDEEFDEEEEETDEEDEEEEDWEE